MSERRVVDLGSLGNPRFGSTSPHRECASVPAKPDPVRALRQAISDCERAVAAGKAAEAELPALRAALAAYEAEEAKRKAGAR